MVEMFFTVLDEARKFVTIRHRRKTLEECIVIFVLVVCGSGEGSDSGGTGRARHALYDAALRRRKYLLGPNADRH